MLKSWSPPYQMDNKTALQALYDIKWFYEHEWFYSELRDEEYRRDTRNIAFYVIKTELMKRLKRLQRNLVEPASEIVEWQKERLPKLRKRVVEEHTLAGHIMTLERNIPRITREIEDLRGAEELEDLLIAVDTVINELHYAYPLVKHIANILSREAIKGEVKGWDTRSPPRPVELALEICHMREEMRGTGRLKAKNLGYEGWTLLDVSVA